MTVSKPCPNLNHITWWPKLVPQQLKPGHCVPTWKYKTTQLSDPCNALTIKKSLTQHQSNIIELHCHDMLHNAHLWVLHIAIVYQVGKNWIIPAAGSTCFWNVDLDKILSYLSRWWLKKCLIDIRRTLILEESTAAVSNNPCLLVWWTLQLLVPKYPTTSRQWEHNKTQQKGSGS